MKKLYFFYQVLVVVSLIPIKAIAQNCNNLSAVSVGYESRCAATGSIKIIATGGSGSYKYRTLGPVNTNYTSTDSITGLAAGSYTVQVNDLISNCIFTINNVIVNGSYQDPRFTLGKTDVSCNNAANGSISLSDQAYGRAPFTYSIVAPSPMAVGSSNQTGNFSNLSAGTYSVRLTDSCGGIQTRQITINNYTWSLVAYPFTKTACTQASGHIQVTDSRGNSSIAGGIPGFMYGVVRAAGDTIWSASAYFNFALTAGNSFQVIAKDSCGIIKTAAVNVYLAPSLGANVLISNKTCSSFTAALADVRNFFGARFCLLDSNEVQIACNNTGVFNNLPYGRYCLTAFDSCTNSTIKRCVQVTAPPLSVAANVQVSNKTCSNFTATITGQVGLTNPQYCLLDSSNNQLACNSTGMFPNLPYGSYCITVKDGCRDTSIARCFEVRRPRPSVRPIVPSYVNCDNFGIWVLSDSLLNPQYCLYDSLGVLITCNNTGIFDSLQLGSYCVNVYDSCYDTTIIQCFSVGMPVLSNTLQVNVRNKTCSNFEVSATSSGIPSATYCLYNAADSLLSCNTTGIFTGLAYGSYCVKLRSACPDTVFVRCFTESPPVPAVNSNVNLSKFGCSTFAATITGQTNLTSPQYCLYNAADVLLQCNSTGEFENIPYGDYCIRITDLCYDTTIIRCFSKMPTPVSIVATASKSCAFNYAKFALTLSNANFPVTVKILDTAGNLFLTRSFAAAPVQIDSIPGVASGFFYTIIAEDNCGNKDTAITGAIASFFSRSVTVVPKCPGASWANGSGNIVLTTNTNMGTATVRIIKKDNVAYGSPLVPNTVAGGVHTYNDMGPGVYILRSHENTCNKYVYDTVTVLPYQFPNLNRSTAYQCDEGGFSVSAVASLGVGPYSYQIIGSVPEFPTISSTPQSSPVFNINNGATYSLIRLRALDACGNATLGDASILPLTNNGITATSNCMHYPTTITADTVFNATYAWYKKPNLAAADSIYMGSTPGLYIPSLTLTDTGTYVCYMDVNQGCIKRTYHYRLTGSCYIVLPVQLVTFNGMQHGNLNVLQWQVRQEEDVRAYVLEKKVAGNQFASLQHQDARGAGGQQLYRAIDAAPLRGANYYRLKMINKDGTVTYSNVVVLHRQTADISCIVYPNPASNGINVRFDQAGEATYDVMLLNMRNQIVMQQRISAMQNNSVQLRRPASLPAGIYMLRINATQNNFTHSQKIIFL